MFEVEDELMSFAIDIYFSCWGDEAPDWSGVE